MDWLEPELVLAFVGMLMSCILSGIGAGLGVVRLLLKSQMSSYLDSPDGKLKVKAIIKEDCDKRHRDERLDLKEFRDDVTAEMKNLYRLIESLGDKLFEIRG